MKFTLAFAALIASVFAGEEPCSSSAPAPSPTPSPSGPSYFGVMSARSASPIHLQALTARGGKFYLGGPGPSSYCPVEVVGNACPPGNSTVLAGGDKTLSLAVVVPGGQQVYVAPDGSLSYTQAHSAYIPTGSIVDQFSREAPRDGRAFGYLNFPTGFVACPAGHDAGYQVFAQIEGGSWGAGCLGFSALTVETDQPGAWQY